MTKAPNLDLLLKKASRVISIVLIGWVVLAILLKKPTWTFSAILGATFSYFVMKDLVITSSLVIAKKTKKVAIVRFFSRLLLYACPLIIYFRFDKYFNIIIILIFLFSFQATFIGTEFVRSIKRIRKKNG